MEEDEHVARRRRGAGVHGEGLVEAEHRAQPGEQLRVALRRGGRDVLGHRLAGLLELDLAARGREPADGLLALRREVALEAGLELLEDARDGEEPGRLDRGEVGDDLARVRARRDRHAEHDRQVVVGVALGDVRGRQPGDDLRAVGEPDHVVGRHGGGHDVAVHELDALGRPGRARRVDQREDVLGLRRRASAAPGRSPGRRPPRPPRRRRPSPSAPSITISVSSAASSARARAERLQVGRLDDRDLRPRVADDVGDLRGRERRVDRERRRAQRHHGEVGDVELGPVAHHQRDGVPAPHAQPGQAAGQRVDAVAQLRPREADLVVLRADRDAVRMVLDRQPEGLGHGARAERPARRRGGCVLPHGAESTGRRSPRPSAGRCRWSARS